MSEWIKCSERLPEARELCLAYMPYADLTVVAQLDACGQWCDELDHEYLCDEYPGQVTYWMPLPERPKEAL